MRAEISAEKSFHFQARAWLHVEARKTRETTEKVRSRNDEGIQKDTNNQAPGCLGV